jgi:guanine nucleotide-binding protein alpha-1 subunit
MPTAFFAPEVTVHSSSGWKGNFIARVLSKMNNSDDDGIDWDDPNDPGRIIYACRDDMVRLWEDRTMKKVLDARQIRMQEMSGL